MPTSKLPVTNHALIRFQERFPECSRRDMVELYQNGIDVDPQLIGTLTFSRRRAETDGNKYVLAPDFSGIFVESDGVIVTFLRLGIYQQDVCQKLWGVPPPGKPKGPSQTGCDPYSLSSFQKWLQSTLGIANASFSKDISQEKRRELAYHMRTTPCVEQQAYIWKWEKAVIAWERCRFVIRECFPLKEEE